MMALITMLTRLNMRFKCRLNGFREGRRTSETGCSSRSCSVEVVTPEDIWVASLGDLNRRRGLISGMEDVPAGKSSRRGSAIGNVWLCD